MMKKFLTIIGVLSLVCTVYGQSFSKHHIITTGSLPSGASLPELADIDNDGDLDILTSARHDDYIYYLENLGNEEFTVLQKLEIELFDINRVQSGDINNDGLIDIIYSRSGETVYQISWLRNIGEKTFEKGGNISTTSDYYGYYSIYDFNGDNYDDIIITFTNGELYVMINRGDETFYPKISLIDQGELSVYQCIDFDNDNDIDVVYSSSNPYNLVLSLNNGFGEFTEKVILDTNYQSPIYDFHSFDSDGDGDIDLFGSDENDSIALFINIGENVFNKISIQNDSLFSAYNLNSIDIDNDNDLDLLNGYGEIFENIGEYSFKFLKFDNLRYLSDNIVDLNQNGDEDFVYGYYSGSIGYIEDASFENISTRRILTSQLLQPMYPDYKSINNDDFPDICISDNPYKYVFYINNGFGEFPNNDTVSVDRLHLFTSENGFYDINHDGFCDIVSYFDNEYYSGRDSCSFKFARNNQNNTFTPIHQNNFNFLNNHEAYFNDLDNDSLLDVILSEDYHSSGTDTILILNVDENFLVRITDSITLGYPLEIRDMKFYDIDNNGYNDIIIHDEHTLYANYNTTSGFPNYFDTITISTDYINDFVIANITKDTICDILLLNSYSIQVLENFNGNSFDTTYNIYTSNYPQVLFSEDLNNDGIEEVIYVSSDTIKLIHFEANNKYVIETYYYNNHASYFRKRPFIFPDIDLDGDKDLLCTYHMISDLSWFENSFIDTVGYTPFPDTNTVWTEQNTILEGNPPQTWTSLFKTESDTILNNNNYTNIYEYYLDPNTFDTIRMLYASIRQDVLAKKVFVIRHYLSEQNEKLLLDFKAIEGDTIILDAYYWDADPLNTDSIFVVDSIRTTALYNLEERDLLYMSNHNEQNPVTLNLTEGVGSIQNPFGPITRLTNKKQRNAEELCCPDYLICMTVNEEPVYVLNNESSCNSLEVWSSIQNISQNELFEIFPNPATNRLHIKFNLNQSSSYDVDIYNNMGVKLSTITCSKKENVIDVERYNPGVYFISLKYNNVLYSSKFIITK